MLLGGKASQIMIHEQEASSLRRLGWLSASKVLQSLLSFVALSYLARVLGPGFFGILGFATQVVAYFVLASSLGIPTFIMREIAASGQPGKSIGRAIPATLILAVLCYLLLIVGTSPLLLHLSVMERAVVDIMGLQVLTNALSLSAALSGARLTNISAWASLIGTLLRVGLILLCIHHPSDLPELCALTILGAAATVAWQWAGMTRLTSIEWRFSLSDFYHIIKQSLLLSASTVMTQIYGSTDIILLGWLVNMQVVGYYSAAYRIPLFLAGFSVIYGQILIPGATRLYLRNPGLLKQKLRSNLNYTAVAVIPIAVGGSVLAHPIVVAVYSGRFSPAATPMAILMWSWAIAFITLHYGQVLIAIGQEKIFAQGIFLGAVLNVLLNLWFIPPWGAAGSAIAITVTEFFILIFMGWKVCRILGAYGPNFSVIMRTTLNAGTMGGYLLWSRSHESWPFAIASAMVLYGILMIVTRTLTKKDWSQISIALSRPPKR
ncbi:MAG: flippase [Firmicutes bacterium]|jgi:O-antigen/teichoic acid export membrane protein|nr:flippase [Bacillota bacterium]